MKATADADSRTAGKTWTVDQRLMWILTTTTSVSVKQILHLTLVFLLRFQVSTPFLFNTFSIFVCLPETNIPYNKRAHQTEDP